MKTDGLEIIIRGAANSGKSTTAKFVEMALQEEGYVDVRLEDLPPSTTDKRKWKDRRQDTLKRPVTIRVELVGGGGGAAVAVEPVVPALAEGEIAPDAERCAKTMGSARCRLYAGHSTNGEDGGGHRMHWEKSKAEAGK